MTDEEYAEQCRVWDLLYARLQSTLSPFGQENYVGEADYWIVSENWGGRQHVLYVHDLKMLAPVIVSRLQASLRDFPDWEILVDVTPNTVNYGQ